MLKRILYHLSKLFHGFYAPRMIYYKKDFQKKPIKNLRIGNTTFIDASKNLKLADNVYIGHHNFIEASNGVEIHEGCQITSFITMTSHSSHHSIRYYGSSYANFEDHLGYVKGAISIGKFTYIGPYVTIMPGTTIGEGSIISAYSYVKGTFPPYSIIAGNPATVVGSVTEKDKQFLDVHPELHHHYMK